MSAPRTAQLFEHEGDQCVLLPEGFEFEGEEVLIRKEGGVLILEPVPLSGTETQ